MADSALYSFTAHDGNNLAVMEWPLPEGIKRRGVIIIVHGLGEHAGRYDHVAERLNGWGFAVRGYDQHGHGESDGKPGALPSDSYLLDNLADIVESTRLRMDASMPLILLGHSLGGLVAARLVSLNRIKVDGLVLSSPALDAGMSRFQKFLIGVLPRFAPNLRVGNGLDPSFLSHESTVVQAYLDDPKVHDRISARLARFIADAGPATLACASQWRVPTLLIYAGADKLVDPAGSRAFAKAAPRNVVASQCFDSMYHEIFNEVEREKVFSRLRAWLDANFHGQ